MRILIIGGGKVAEYLLRLLEGSNITVVEKNRERCEYLAEKYENVNILHSKAEDTDVLESLGISDFDVVFVVTGQESVNIATSFYLRHMGAKSIYCRLSNERYKEVLEEVGIAVVSENSTLAEMFVMRAFEPEKLKILSFLAVERRQAPEGKSVGELIKEGFYPLLLLRKGELIVPSLDEQLSSEDEILLLRKK